MAARKQRQPAPLWILLVSAVLVVYTSLHHVFLIDDDNEESAIFVDHRHLANISPPELTTKAVTGGEAKNSEISEQRNEDLKSIRRWGCGRNETPFIFVHIGKSGGGTVRRRIAAGATNYTLQDRLPNKWMKMMGGFYPIPKDDIIIKGIFCQSNQFQTWPNATILSYEHTMPCSATTPLGQAIACPHPRRPNRDCCKPNLDICPNVYAGHNVVGSELHWLPPRYLQRWWRSMRPTLGASRNRYAYVASGLRILHTEQWCPKVPSEGYGERLMLDYGSRSTMNTVPTMSRGRMKNVSIAILERMEKECSRPLINRTDTIARFLYQNRSQSHLGDDWSPLYASLPVLRATVIRDPFSWLVSKFFWHSLELVSDVPCDDIEYATAGSGIYPRNVRETQSQMIKVDSSGWAQQLALSYIIHLCGEDCAVRVQQTGFDPPGINMLNTLERQADGNLRQSFSVVGLLNESDTFYDMLSARVSYMELNQENVKDVLVSPHSAISTPEAKRCKAQFLKPEFQQRLVRASPEIAALSRLYQTAVDVNRHQLRELQTCSPQSFGHADIISVSL